MNVALHWFRRDLRVRDNTALAEAARAAPRVVPVFILEEAFRTGPDVGAARLAFLLRSLQTLRESLVRLGYPLVIRRGRSEIELPKLCRELGAGAVFCNRRYEPHAQARDGRVCRALSALGIAFQSFKDAVIWEDRDILTKTGNPYAMFTPYAKAWRTRPIPPPQRSLPPAAGRFPNLASDCPPGDPVELGHPLAQTIFPAGEAAGLKLLDDFLGGAAHRYAEERNLPALAGTSRLSPHLRCGTVGIRTVLAGVAAARAQAAPPQQAGCDAFLTELIWREFFLQILANFPHVAEGPYRREYQAVHWSENKEHFEAWCQGMTGYPIIDAAMRCLNATGWMHNRLRMLTAMFLIKDLLLPWQWGERYFMRQLVDGDPAANNGNWQWCAGTGADAAPYFRVFNPTTQAEKFDPAGAFVREWVPELSALPGKQIHRPWEQPRALQPSNYPRPLVRHDEQRPKFLALFRSARSR